MDDISLICVLVFAVYLRLVGVGDIRVSRMAMFAAAF